MNSYLFEVKGETQLAGITAESTHLFTADTNTATEILGEMGSTADLRRCVAKKGPAGGIITGADLLEILPYIAENLSEELADDHRKIKYYEPVELSELSFDQIDALLDMMTQYLSFEDATPDDPYYFDAWQIARNVISEGGVVSPQNILKR